jgi:hypothetical protein
MDDIVVKTSLVIFTKKRAKWSFLGQLSGLIYSRQTFWITCTATVEKQNHETRGFAPSPKHTRVNEADPLSLDNLYLFTLYSGQNS